MDYFNEVINADIITEIISWLPATSAATLATILHIPRKLLGIPAICVRFGYAWYLSEEYAGNLEFILQHRYLFFENLPQIIESYEFHAMCKALRDPTAGGANVQINTFDLLLVRERFAQGDEVFREKFPAGYYLSKMSQMYLERNYDQIRIGFSYLAQYFNSRKDRITLVHDSLLWYRAMLELNIPGFRQSAEEYWLPDLIEYLNPANIHILGTALDSDGKPVINLVPRKLVANYSDRVLSVIISHGYFEGDLHFAPKESTGCIRNYKLLVESAKSSGQEIIIAHVDEKIPDNLSGSRRIIFLYSDDMHKRSSSKHQPCSFFKIMQPLLSLGVGPKCMYSEVCLPVKLMQHIPPEHCREFYNYVARVYLEIDSSEYMPNLDRYIYIGPKDAKPNHDKYSPYVTARTWYKLTKSCICAENLGCFKWLVENFKKLPKPSAQKSSILYWAAVDGPSAEYVEAAISAGFKLTTKDILDLQKHNLELYRAVKNLSGE